MWGEFETNDIIKNDKTAEEMYNEVISSQTEDIAKYLNSPENFDNLSNALKNNLWTDLENKLTIWRNSLSTINFLKDNIKNIDQKDLDQKDLAWLKSLKDFVENCVLKNEIILKAQNDINEWLRWLAEWNKRTRKDNLNINPSEVSLIDGKPTFEYTIEGQTITFELNNDPLNWINKIQPLKTNININGEYQKINKDFWLENNSDGFLNELQDYSSESFKVDVSKSDKWFDAKFKKDGKEVAVFNLDESGLINGSTKRSKDWYELKIDQKWKKFNLINLNPAKEGVVEVESDEVRELKNKLIALDLTTTVWLKTANKINSEIVEQKNKEKEIKEKEKILKTKNENLGKLKKDAAKKAKNGENISKLLKDITELENEINWIEDNVKAVKEEAKKEIVETNVNNTINWTKNDDEIKITNNIKTIDKSTIIEISSVSKWNSISKYSKLDNIISALNINWSESKEVKTKKEKLIWLFNSWDFKWFQEAIWIPKWNGPTQADGKLWKHTLGKVNDYLKKGAINVDSNKTKKTNVIEAHKYNTAQKHVNETTLVSEYEFDHQLELWDYSTQIKVLRKFINLNKNHTGFDEIILKYKNRANNMKTISDYWLRNQLKYFDIKSFDNSNLSKWENEFMRNWWNDRLMRINKPLTPKNIKMLDNIYWWAENTFELWVSLNEIKNKILNVKKYGDDWKNKALWKIKDIIMMKYKDNNIINDLAPNLEKFEV